MSLRIFISAGDVSGDIHAGNLVRSIKNIAQDSFVSALGGQKLKETCDEFVEDLTSLSAFGFWQPIKLYFRLKSIFENKIRNKWQEKKPDKVILVDYYGFNIHVAKLAHKMGIPVYYYIAPQVWATRHGRLKKLSRYVNKMLFTLPFEGTIYRSAGMDADFVGHPLLDVLPQAAQNDLRSNEKPIIGLFPGSRPNVFFRHMPILLETARKINKEIPCDFRIISVKGLADKCANLPFQVITEENYLERSKLKFAITTSGTVSLENALLGIPMVVFYKLSWFNYYIAKMLIKIPYITMVNILAQKEIVPELIQEKADPENIAQNVLSFLKNKKRYVQLREQLLAVRKQLGSTGVSDRAARIILGQSI